MFLFSVNTPSINFGLLFFLLACETCDAAVKSKANLMNEKATFSQRNFHLSFFSRPGDQSHARQRPQTHASTVKRKYLRTNSTPKYSVNFSVVSSNEMQRNARSRRKYLKHESFSGFPRGNNVFKNEKYRSQFEIYSKNSIHATNQHGILKARSMEVAIRNSSHRCRHLKHHSNSKRQEHSRNDFTHDITSSSTTATIYCPVKMNAHLENALFQCCRARSSDKFFKKICNSSASEITNSYLCPDGPSYFCQPSINNFTSLSSLRFSLNLPANCFWVREVTAKTSWMRLFNNDTSLLCLTNPHWLKFDAPVLNGLQEMTVNGAYAIVALTGTAGNMAAIFLFSSSRSLRSPSNLLIISLAVSDLSLVSTLWLYLYNSVRGQLIGCALYGMAGGLAGTAAILNLSAISLDRCLAITFPLHPGRKLSTRQAWLIIAFIWSYALSFAVVPLLGIEGVAYVPEGNGHSCSFDYLSPNTNNLVFIWTYFVGAWVVPLVIIACSYAKIATVARRHLLSRLESQSNRLEMSHLLAKNKYLHKLYDPIPSESYVSQHAEAVPEGYKYNAKRAFCHASIFPINVLGVWMGFRFQSSLQLANSTGQRHSAYHTSILKKSYSVAHRANSSPLTYQYHRFVPLPGAGDIGYEQTAGSHPLGAESKRLYKQPSELSGIPGGFNRQESPQIHATSTCEPTCPPQFRPRIKPRAERSHRCNRIMHKVSREMRLTRIPAGLVLLWFSAWTPYAVVALLGISGFTQLLTPLSVVVPGLACKLAACIDPYVYALSHPRCKVELKKRLRALCRSFSSSSTRLNFHARSSELVSASGVSTKAYKPRTNQRCNLHFSTSLKPANTETLNSEYLPGAPGETLSLSTGIQTANFQTFDSSFRRHRTHAQPNSICEPPKLGTLDESTNQKPCNKEHFSEAAKLSTVDESVNQILFNKERFSLIAADTNSKLLAKLDHRNRALLSVSRSGSSTAGIDYGGSAHYKFRKVCENSNSHNSLCGGKKYDIPFEKISSTHRSNVSDTNHEKSTSNSKRDSHVPSVDCFQLTREDLKLIPFPGIHLQEPCNEDEKISALPNSKSERDFMQQRKLDTIVFLKTDFASVYSSPLRLLARSNSTNELNSVQ